MNVWHARYRCMVGDRRVNSLMAHAGLGVTGAFGPTMYELSWKPGEEVDMERAKKLCSVLQYGLNTSEIECSSVECIEIWHTEV